MPSHLELIEVERRRPGLVAIDKQIVEASERLDDALALLLLPVQLLCLQVVLLGLEGEHFQRARARIELLLRSDESTVSKSRDVCATRTV